MEFTAEDYPSVSSGDSADHIDIKLQISRIIREVLEVNVSRSTPEEGSNGKLVSVRRDVADALATVQSPASVVGVSTLILNEYKTCMSLQYAHIANHYVSSATDRSSDADLDNGAFNDASHKTQGLSPEQFFTKMLRGVDIPTLPYGLSDIHDDSVEVMKARLVLPQNLNDRLRGHTQRMGNKMEEEIDFDDPKS
ncbi:hypothetical protein BGZ80_010685 [Entomortierella chlamydospora]|uniref:Uncharacterized protein n=1 Tax=Entomortierella chlamydospora TaxID=101097 RepID=A0A9P6SZU7_9FUNG|nr:hypothetical protein BGZ80_010685 [Entomortierella chlamydospora]